MPSLIVATADGVHLVDAAGAEPSAEPSAEPTVDHAGRPVTSLGRAGAAFWALLDPAELWRWDDGSWTHVADLDGGPRATCVAGIGPEVFVGSSEAHLFRLQGGRLELLEGFEEAEGRDNWYTPWGGPPDTRSIANWDEHLYVNVHVGGILRSDDGGETWTPTIDIDADVHQVTAAEGLVLAACARGLAQSTDRGATWRYRTDGLHARYSRAVAVCGDALLLSASQGPRGGGAAVYRANPTDGPFERCRSGLPEWFDDNIDTSCLDALPDGSLAAFGTADGRLFVSRDQGSTWDLIAQLPEVHRVLVMP